MNILDELFPKTTVRSLEGSAAFMDETRFWEYVDYTHHLTSGEYKDQIPLLRSYLSRMSERELVQFDARFKELLDQAYDAKLWDAAKIISNGDGSEETFLNFRAWLIAQGKITFYKALEYTESLAELNTFQVLRSWGGMSDLSKQVLNSRETSKIQSAYELKNKLRGTRCVDNEELKAVYPILWERYEKAHQLNMQ